MQAIIMAGGKGTRLRPYTNILPKPLLPVGNQSILDINIKQLVASGVDNIIIAVGYLGELIEAVIGNGDKYGIKINYSYESKPLGTVGGLGLINDLLEENFIVMNGDILHDLSISHLFKEHVYSKKNVTITTYLQQNTVRLGVIEVENNNIIKYVEKPTTEYIVSIGIYVLNKHIIDTFVSEKNYLDFPTLINILIQDAQKINSFMHNGLWIDIGTTEEYINLVENLDKIVEENPLIPISV
jgi:NDP-sugar pyrophosphorylase family protein